MCDNLLLLAINILMWVIKTISNIGGKLINSLYHQACNRVPKSIFFTPHWVCLYIAVYGGYCAMHAAQLILLLHQRMPYSDIAGYYV